MRCEKWSTTEHPLCIILMELSIERRLRNISMDLSWILREQNCMADELSNGIIHAFQECNRITTELATLKLQVQEELIESSSELYLDINIEVAKGLKRRKAETLKVTQPWKWLRQQIDCQ